MFTLVNLFREEILRALSVCTPSLRPGEVTDICANVYYYHVNPSTRSTWPRPKEMISWLERRGTTRCLRPPECWEKGQSR